MEGEEEGEKAGRRGARRRDGESLKTTRIRS